MGESVLFSFLCKLIAGLIDFSWPRPSASPLTSLPDGGSRAEGAEYSGSEWEARAGGGCPPGVPQDHSWLRPGMTSPGLERSGANPTFLTVCWVLQVWGPVFFKSFSRVWPHLRVHYHCQNWPLVSLQGWLGTRRPVSCCNGAGVLFFSKLPLTFVQFFCSPTRLPSCCSASPTSPQPPRPLNFWKAHLQYLCLLWDGSSVSSHALFVRVVCGFFFFSSFLSLSEKIVAAFLSLGFKKRFREVVWGRRVVRHTREVGGVRAALTTPCSWAPSLLFSPAILPTKSEGLKSGVLGGYGLGGLCH